MKKIVLHAALLAGAAYVYMQIPASAQRPKLATWMPGGALLYLESPDFRQLLSEWDASKVKTDWLASGNYETFSRSNLLLKLSEVYDQYSKAAGFEPALKSALEIAGTDSALALYEMRNVEFLYVTRLNESVLTKAELWAMREKFEQRQAAGTSFYLRTDAASGRTVAFTFTRGYLFLATRDDLMAEALQLLAGESNPSIATDRWYREAAAAAAEPGELRLVMNLEALVKSTYFRSYWIQRNASAVRQYWAGVADIRRTGEGLVESRTFLRAPDAAAEAARGSVSGLVPLAPPEAGLYKASGVSDPAEAAALVAAKLIGPQTQRVTDWRFAPLPARFDNRAGSEADLETRIDDQPLPADPGVADAIAAIGSMLRANGATATLLVQSSAPAGRPFVLTPSVIVVEGGNDWDGNAVRATLSTAVGRVWTSARIGAGWTPSTAGGHAVHHMDGPGNLIVATRGRLLLLGNDRGTLAQVLDRAAEPALNTPVTYAAAFRHFRERENYDRMMRALDSGAPGAVPFGLEFGRGGPAFFSGNIASLSSALSAVRELRIEQSDTGAVTTQTVVYTITTR